MLGGGSRSRIENETVGEAGFLSKPSSLEVMIINLTRGTAKTMKIYNEKPWQIDKGQKTMEDVIQAKNFIRDIGGPGKVTSIIGQAAYVLNQMFPHPGEPRKQWTERRLWEWWNRQSDLVRHWQMMEMYRAAEIKKQERKLLEAARREHAEFIAKTRNLRSLLERTDEDFFSPEIEGLGGVMGRSNRSRTEGE